MSSRQSSSSVRFVAALVGSLAAASPVVALAQPSPRVMNSTAANATPPANALAVPAVPALPPANIVTAPAAGAVAPATKPADADRVIDYDTPRFEPAGLPIVGGTSDIGVMAGAVLTLTRFGLGQRPYKWNMDIVASASFKQDGSGNPEVIQQNYLWQLDVPGAFGGNVRVNPAVSYERTINQGYYGIGNASPLFPTNVPSGDVSRYNQFVAQEARVRELTRVKLKGPLDLMVATTYRYVAPDTYVGSRLVDDANAKAADGGPAIRGLTAMSLAQLGVGVIYDTRDNEFFPHRGMYHQVGVKAVQGMPFENDVRYVEAGAILAGFVPLARDVVVASRFVVDVEAGNVPFYDLSRAGPFLSYDMIGGPQGVRGVPIGRYAGLGKVIGNVELRAMLVDFRALGQSLHVGGDLFFDTGRAFADLSFNAPSDGKGVGLKYGAGGGVFVRWGEAAIFRVDIAYSPDAAAESPQFPFGVYVQDGLMF